MDRKEVKEALVKAKQSLSAVKKQYYSQHLYEFNKDILAWPDLYEPLHRRVCEFVQDNYKKKKLVILLPRGTFKSSVITVGLSLWQIARNPESRILISNAVHPMATSFLGQIKKHLQYNDRFREVFGDLSSTADSWREDRISVSKEKLKHKEPTIWAYGMGASSVGSHFDMAILDDLVGRENIGTKEQIEKTKTYFKDVLDLVDPRPDGHKIVIIIGTTWHWDDLYSWILDKENGLLSDFKVLRLPAYEGEWGKGKLLFPKRLTWKTMERLKAQQGLSHFSAQYMLNPIPEESQTFKPPFKRYEETDLKGVLLNKFMCVDPALSEKKDADYSAITVIGVDKDNSWYVLDIWRDQVLPSRLLDQIFYMDEKWRPITIGLETTAYQRILQYQLNDEMKKRNKFLAVKELKHTDMSKDERIRGLQPRYEIGTVFHPQRQSIKLVDYLEDELQRFPRAAHDDIIDSLSFHLEVAFPPRAKQKRSEYKSNHYPA